MNRIPNDAEIQRSEVYISVDIETSGPIPGIYSLLTIGACDCFNPEKSFSCEFQPTTANFDPDALKVTGLSLKQLTEAGASPKVGMQKFSEWIAEVSGTTPPIFVGFNAAFDWSFINYYFHCYLGENPFGFAALDIKSMYMGAMKSTWSETRSEKIAKTLRPKSKGDHNALHDALYQAELFRLILQR